MRRFRNMTAMITTVYAIISLTESEGGHVSSQTISPLSPTPEHAQKTAKRLKLGPKMHPSSVGGTTVTGIVGAKIGYHIQPVQAVFIQGQSTRAYLLTDTTVHKVASNNRRKGLAAR